ELDSGQILIDDIDITKLSRQTLREQFGIVLQDTWLFNGSIKDNIAYGNKGVTDEAIYNAARPARADELIQKLPDGYDTLSHDKIHITNFSRQTLRAAGGIVLPETWLFNASIKDNIAYGKKGVTDEAIYNAAKTARADEFIQKLPDGYETILNEEASNISTG